MVENGHNEPGREVAEFGFTNPDRAPLGIEVADYGRMTSRLSPQMLASVHCTDVHQVVLITAGHAPTMVDFIDHLCPPGTRLHVSPGRVLRLPARPARPLRRRF